MKISTPPPPLYLAFSAGFSRLRRAGCGDSRPAFLDGERRRLGRRY